MARHQLRDWLIAELDHHPVSQATWASATICFPFSLRTLYNYNYNHDDIYSAVIMAEPLRKFTRLDSVSKLSKIIERAMSEENHRIWGDVHVYRTAPGGRRPLGTKPNTPVRHANCTRNQKNFLLGASAGVSTGERTSTYNNAILIDDVEWVHGLYGIRVWYPPAPQPISATNCRRNRRLSPNSATVAGFGNSRRIGRL